MSIDPGPLRLAQVRHVASAAHAGQLDALGAPYQGHLDRVSARAELLRSQHARDIDSYDVACVALAHDLLEDTAVTEADVAFLPAHVLEAIALLTHWPGVSREVYLQDVSTNRLASIVKLADTLDNSDAVRLAHVPDPARRARLEDKYAYALGILAPVVLA